MRSFLAVVADVLPEDSQEMSLSADEDVVQTLPPCSSHESFGDGVIVGLQLQVMLNIGKDSLSPILRGTFIPIGGVCVPLTVYIALTAIQKPCNGLVFPGAIALPIRCYPMAAQRR